MLFRSGDRLGIVTNKPQAAAEEIAQALFPGLFGVVIGERDGQPRKPHPAPARAAAAALGASAADCLFIGDTAIDIETARAAGMRSVGVLWGFRDRLELERAGAEVVVREPADILAL